MAGDKQKRRPNRARGGRDLKAAERDEKSEAGGSTLLREAPPPPPAGAPQLPAELPAAWLEQIKGVSKQGKKEVIIIAILGSTVLAAPVAALFDYLLAPYKASLIDQTEIRKAQLNYENKIAEANLQTRQKELDEKRAAYNALSQQLELLSKLLTNYVSICERASERPAELRYAEFAAASWDLLTDQLGNVTDAEEKCKALVPEDKETGEEVEAITGPLGVNLVSDEVQGSKEKNPELISRNEELQGAIAKVQEKIRRKTDGLTLQPGPQPSPGVAKF